MLARKVPLPELYTITFVLEIKRFDWLAVLHLPGFGELEIVGQDNLRGEREEL
jgi:hypothetical protein